MRNSYLLIFVVFSFLSSCKETIHEDVKFYKKQTINKPHIGLDTLNIESLITNDSILILRNKNLKKLPDLSRFYIKHLDVSGNQLNKIKEEKLPIGLLTINASNNNLTKFKLSYYYKTIFDEVNLSNNKLDTFDLYPFAKRIILNDNNLVYVNFHKKETIFLDISNNEKLSNLVDFSPKGINTILRENILNSKPLLSRRFTKDGGPIIIKD